MNNSFITYGDEEVYHQGRAYIFYGDGSIPSSAGSADKNFTGENATGEFGFSVSSAGDMNNDGYDEVIIGAPGVDNAFIFNWTEDPIVLTGDSNSAFGWSVADLGDIDQDGSFDDVIVGAPWYNSNTGRAYIFYGNTPMNSSIDSTKADVTLTGESIADGFGYSVSSAGDIDGDGAVDVIVGAPFYDNNILTDAGAIYIFKGGLSMSTAAFWLHKGGTAGEHFGWSVSLAGKLDIDTNRDVIVGAPHYDYNFETDAGKAIALTNDTTIPEYHSIAIPIIVIILLFTTARKRYKCSSKRKGKRGVGK
jgi:hypothetical protein